MSTYEVEHNTPDPSTQSTAHRRRRPDLSSFFAILSEITPQESRTRPHAVPVPGEMSAAFFSLAEALEVMRQEGGDAAVEQGSEGHDSIINRMIETLLNDARAPPREVEGVSEEFCDALDRVPRTSLQPTQICPICNNPFLEDEYPLVVRLPCHPAHMFDLECVRPWLRLRGTCPLDRRDFAKQEREKVEASRQRVVDDEEEDDMDGMYG